MNRKILYGYQIQDGVLAVQPEEATGIRWIFSLYLKGTAMAKIAEALNNDGRFYSEESPDWNWQKISHTLRNPHYCGKDGYPALVDAKTFRMAQEQLEKRARKWGDHPALCLMKKFHCADCGNALRRIAERQWNDTLRLQCDQCGAAITITDAELLTEVERQAAEYIPQTAPDSCYTPSSEVVRLTNAINRGLEHPEQPENVIALILQGVSARYACTSIQMTSTDILRLIKEKAFDQAIQYITISADNAVTVTFKTGENRLEKEALWNRKH